MLIKETKTKCICNLIFYLFTLETALGGWGLPVMYIWESVILLHMDPALNNKYNCEDQNSSFIHTEKVLSSPVLICLCLYNFPAGGENKGEKILLPTEN